MTDANVAFQNDVIKLFHGDCRDVLRAMPESSVDAIVTDPPYELGFMGRAWDQTGIANNVEMWRECLRVLKPGGHLISFGGTRTSHRMVSAVEDAGFEIRDSLSWIYASGYPKSHDVSKAIDKAAGAKREVVGTKVGLPGYSLAEDKGRGTYSSEGRNSEVECTITAPATDDAKKWEGWGTALKPAAEPAVLARKPLVGTVVANVLAHGTGALNIGACRVEFASEEDERESKTKNQHAKFESAPRNNKVYGEDKKEQEDYAATGRWPANVLLGCACAGGARC